MGTRVMPTTCTHEHTELEIEFRESSATDELKTRIERWLKQVGKQHPKIAKFIISHAGPKQVRITDIDADGDIISTRVRMEVEIPS